MGDHGAFQPWTAALSAQEDSSGATTEDKRPPELSQRLAALLSNPKVVKPARAVLDPLTEPPGLVLALGRPSEAATTGPETKLMLKPESLPQVRALLLSGKSRPRKSRAKRLAADGTIRPKSPILVVESNSKPVVVGRSLGAGLGPETLVRTQLVAFAEAVATDDQPRARFLLNVLQRSASPVGSWHQRLTFYCMEALLARISGTGHDLFLAPPQEPMEMLIDAMKKFYERLPYASFAQEAVNAAIANAVTGHSAVHILSIDVLQNGRWPALMEQLASQPGGPPSLQITSVDCPVLLSLRREGRYRPNTEDLEGEVKEAARQLGYKSFEYRLLDPAMLENLSPEVLNLKKDETLAVACCLRLRNLHDGAVVRTNPRDTFLQRIRALRPKVVALAEMDSEQNGPFFIKRFKAALDFFGPLFELHDAVFLGDSTAIGTLERNVFARDLVNVVACEGLQRVLRCERLDGWRERLKKAGFQPYHTNALHSQALRELIACGPEGLSLISNREALQLAWKGQVLLFAACWQPQSS